MLEIIVRDALLEYLMKHKILPESQYGFLPGRSVSMGLICAHTDWVAAKSRGDFVGVIAFDLSSAFDTVDSAKLTQMLELFGVKGRPLN